MLCHTPDRPIKGTSVKDDVDEAAAVVKVRAIRHKPPHKTTEEIL
jgi:hypothetical protein